MDSWAIVFRCSISERMLIVNTSKNTQTKWDVHYSSSGLPLERKSYESFKISSDSSRSLLLPVTNHRQETFWLWYSDIILSTIILINWSRKMMSCMFKYWVTWNWFLCVKQTSEGPLSAVSKSMFATAYLIQSVLRSTRSTCFCTVPKSTCDFLKYSDVFNTFCI